MEKLRANPFNYSGSKFRFLPHILKELPEGDYKFLDAFCGGGDVGLNVPYTDVHLNDGCQQLMNMYEAFKTVKPPKLANHIQLICEQFGLDRVNAANYEKLKEAYNKIVNTEGVSDPFLLYTLICHSFSNNMRFNSVGNFNLPFGKRTFNPSLQDKLVHWGLKLRQKEPKLTSQNFKELDFLAYDVGYYDPPYFVTNACYQETSGLAWGEEEEHILYTKLEEVDSQGGRFILSNQLFSKNKENEILKDFILKNKFRAMHIKNGSYENCNYQRKDGKTVELLIMNY